MSDALQADPDGLRAAAARTDYAADELAESAPAGFAAGDRPTALAVRRIDAVVAGIRSAQARKLTSTAKTLRSAGDGFEGVDLGSADSMRYSGE